MIKDGLRLTTILQRHRSMHKLDEWINYKALYIHVYVFIVDKSTHLIDVSTMTYSQEIPLGQHF